MSIGGLKEADALTRDEWIAYRELAQEALDAWQHGEAMHVSGTREEDLQELVVYCEAQLLRIDQGLPVTGPMAYLRAVMRAMRPAVAARLGASGGDETPLVW